MPRHSKSQSATVTLADVASAAGVSPATVSRALNAPHLVREETVATVKRAILLTGYTPNLVAGSLASSRSRLVALVVPTIANSIFSETVQAITDGLARAGYQTLLGLSGYAATQEEELVAAIISRRPDGVILTGTLHTPEARKKLVAANIPIVEIWDLSSAPIDMLVGFSHEAVGRAVARHLHARGYRRFGLISASDQRAEARRLGMVAELRSLGLETVDNSIFPAPARLRLGREGMARLLDGGHKPDVVVCSSDTLAHGALAEAQTRGLSVPGDIAVMGFGDLDFAADTFPPLSTVRIDGTAIGTMAADLLLARLKSQDLPDPIRDVGFTLVDRASA